MLKFDGRFRFESPGEISQNVVSRYLELIGRIAAQADRRKPVYEHFKSYFAEAAGTTSYPSSDTSWAETDLRTYMNMASENAPLFIEAFYDACVALHANQPEIFVPEYGIMNRVLRDEKMPYEINPPNLVTQDNEATITVPVRELSLDEEAQATIVKSLRDAEDLLMQGKERAAVQEILWLLETVSTAFRGAETETGTISGKYFNHIVKELRNAHKGLMTDQALGWMTALHGYLSSPTGGGVRHGVDLKDGIKLQSDDARLICNLVRSYITYLMRQYELLHQRK